MTITEEMAAIEKWLREPDYAEEFSLQDLTDWLNRRPIAEVGRLTAALADCVVVPKELTPEIGQAIYAAWDAFGEDAVMGPKEAIAVYRAMIAATPK